MLRIAPPLPQLRAHDPCGHWHKGGGDTSRSEERFAANCWEPTIATDGTFALYVITGRHRPNELYMMLYHIATNIWSAPVFRKDILHSNWDGGASLAGNVRAFHNYAYDITGEQYNEITSNPRMVTYVINGTAVNIKDWTGTEEIHGRNKVAVAADGKVYCIVRTSIAWQLQGSVDGGASYSLLTTLPLPVANAAVVVNPLDGVAYAATISGPTNQLRVYAGPGWALKSTTAITGTPIHLQFLVDNNRFVVSTGPRFYYSTNNCTSFTARDLRESSIHFAATGTEFYNLADQTDYRTDDYENAVITWDSIQQFETLVDRATIHNAGQMTVYSQAKLRVDGSEGNIVSILLSRNLGERWQEIQTPLNYYETFEETLNLGDDPRWPFVEQYAKL